ncbi:MAG: biotin/lipoyl-binding protein, partial [Ardenticatenales bacterium]|nr:biotin/lipoyl-binding protein [Ardenticatenales bacterium]
MHPNPRRVLPVVVVIGIVGALLWGWWSQQAAAADGALHGSGTIEATEVIIAPEIMGRVLEVSVRPGDSVEEGQTLIAFDPTLLEAQRKQAEATLSAAEAMHEAAQAGLAATEANHALLEAGPSEEQRAVAESTVARAQAAADAARAAYDALPEAVRQSAQAQPLSQ